MTFVRRTCGYVSTCTSAEVPVLNQADASATSARCCSTGMIPSAQVLSAAYSPAQPDQLRQEGRVSGLYLMMGRGLERLQVRSVVAAWQCQRSTTG
jgi:hypothetical protein